MAYKTSSGRGGPPNPIDIHVGKRIYLQRRILNMTQQEFAKALGLTFQQVQKYEKGLNRISCSRLYDISRVLEVEIAFFFQDMSADVSDKSPSQLAGIKPKKHLADATVGSSQFSTPDVMQSQETLELVRNYYRITDEAVRKHIFGLCASMAKEIVGRKPGQKLTKNKKPKKAPKNNPKKDD